MPGGYIFCEWESVRKTFPKFQQTFASAESMAIAKATADWKPKTFNPTRSFSPGNNEFGRTTILPALFKDNTGTQMTTWLQKFTSTGDQTVLAGAGAGNTIPEDFKVAWVGLAFPNMTQHLTEIKYDIGVRKYGRINLEEIRRYKVPAVIFEEPLIIDEEESFEMKGYVPGPIPSYPDGSSGIYQRIIMLGALYYKVKDKVLGDCGAAIS